MLCNFFKGWMRLGVRGAVKSSVCVCVCVLGGAGGNHSSIKTFSKYFKVIIPNNVKYMSDSNNDNNKNNTMCFLWK